MAKPKVLKVHYFDDCTGFYYSQPEDVKFTKEILGITCGQCKGRILNVIRDQDWSMLDDDERCVLEMATLTVDSLPLRVKGQRR